MKDFNDFFHFFHGILLLEQVASGSFPDFGFGMDYCKKSAPFVEGINMQFGCQAIPLSGQPDETKGNQKMLFSFSKNKPLNELKTIHPILF
jgi:hypothetical protein